MTNEVLNTMKTRRSCRCYLDKMPEPEALNAVLEAGTWAPTGMGRQSPVIVCIQNKADRDTFEQDERRRDGRQWRPVLWCALRCRCAGG